MSVLLSCITVVAPSSTGIDTANDEPAMWVRKFGTEITSSGPMCCDSATVRAAAYSVFWLCTTAFIAPVVPEV